MIQVRRFVELRKMIKFAYSQDTMIIREIWMMNLAVGNYTPKTMKAVGFVTSGSTPWSSSKQAMLNKVKTFGMKDTFSTK